MVLPLNLAMTPSEFSTAASLPEKIAWMSCRFSTAGIGLENLPESLPEGSLLILDDSTPCSGHNADEIAKILDKLISRFSCSSLLLDFQRPRSKETIRIVSAIIEALPCPVAVTPEYAHNPSCAVFLPPAPLHMPLKTYLEPWSGREIWLEAALDREIVTLTKSGTAFLPVLTPDSLGGGFFSEELCCQYKTGVQKGEITFTLFDTPETLRKKLELAHSLGIPRAVGLYQELNQYIK